MVITLPVAHEAFRGQGIYPYSLASAGQINAESVEVFGLPAGEYGSLDADTNPILSYDEADKEPSHIVSNSTAGGADEAVTLGNDTKIAGDVKTSGEIEVDGSAQIQGNLLPNSAEQNLPNVSIEAYDPAGESDTYPWTGAIPAGATAPVLVGRSRYDGNLTINNLDMAEGLLYVDGDVTITGTVKGKGAIVATGKITVTGSMDTNADHAALVAKDDITIHGNGPNSSKFQGLVYSEGSIDIARTTIMGAAVSKDTVGTTKLEEVKAISVPELTKMDFEQHLTLQEAMEKNAGKATLGIRESNGNFTKLTSQGDTEALKLLAASLAGSDPNGSGWELVVQTSTGFEPLSSLPVRERNGAVDAQNHWSRYVLEHRDNNIRVVDVFSMDLNTLVSLDVQLEMMYHHTVNTEKKN